MRIPEDLISTPRPKPKRWQIALAIIVAVLAVLVVTFRGFATLYTDYLWFDSVDFGAIWTSLLGTKLVLAVIGTLFVAVLMWINLWVVDRYAPTIVSFGPEDELARQFRRFAQPHRRLWRLAAALVLGLIVGSGFTAYWSEWLLFVNGGAFGTTDPQFGKDVGFFVFTLPFLTLLTRWLFLAVGFALVVSVVAHFLNGAIRPQLPRNKVTSAVKAHISVLVALLALVRAGQYWLERYNLSYSTRGPEIVGANYTDVRVLMPALVLLTLISIVAAVALVVGARTRAWTWPVTTVVLWGVVSLVIGTAIPAAVQRFSVAPAEPQKEQPYIQRNVDATRAALALDNVQVNDFQYNDELTAGDLQENAQTVRNIRLWDTELVKPSYQRLQESRTYFQFNDIDIDRYDFNGETTQTMLSVRELNTAKLPSDRQSWVNTHLVFTHGYGAVASPANAVVGNGEPSFTVKDLPPVGNPQITVPQVYFGERTSDYSIVNTREGEVDFTAPDGRDQTSRYTGTGGVQLSNLFTRAAFAARTGDIEPLISNLVTPQSRAMYFTNLRERQQEAAPFLRYDNDPYPVITDGRIKWVQDAYTVTDKYPYAQMANTSQVGVGESSLSDGRFNYVRNSVKIVTDAYDGTMTYYVVDQADPIIKAWAKSFPKLFTTAALPDNIRDHVRYPEDLFRMQSTMFGSYHLNNADDFYRKTDRWIVAQRPDGQTGTQAGATTSANGNTTPVSVVTAPSEASSPEGAGRIEPTYLLIRPPGETQERFLMVQPFSPFSQDNSRKELSAFMLAKSDPEQYGQLQAYVMPRGQQIDGPALIEARIQADQNISQYITLLSRAGSEVLLGDMLVIPIDNALLYVRPLYVRAQSNNVPEFKKAIVVQGDKIAMEDTLQGALTSAFGSAPPTQEAVNPGSGAAQPTTPAVTPSGPGVVSNAATLLDQANIEFTAADQALRSGNLAEYQTRVQAGIALVKQARGQ